MEVITPQVGFPCFSHHGRRTLSRIQNETRAGQTILVVGQCLQHEIVDHFHYQARTDFNSHALLDATLLVDFGGSRHAAPRGLYASEKVNSPARAIRILCALIFQREGSMPRANSPTRVRKVLSLICVVESAEQTGTYLHLARLIRRA